MTSSAKLWVSLGFVGLAIAGSNLACGGRADDGEKSESDLATGAKGGKPADGGACGVAILCQAGTRQVDTNGDGCFDACEPVACPPYVPSCKPGEGPADLDGDGCVDGCKPLNCGPPGEPCPKGTEPADFDGDGCYESCKAIACPPFVPTCKQGEKAADTNGDGCVDGCVACPAILCGPNLLPVDTNGDGCDDTCK